MNNKEYKNESPPPLHPCKSTTTTNNNNKQKDTKMFPRSKTN
jgi:hypothetical protein